MSETYTPQSDFTIKIEAKGHEQTCLQATDRSGGDGSLDERWIESSSGMTKLAVFGVYTGTDELLHTYANDVDLKGKVRGAGDLPGNCTAIAITDRGERTEVAISRNLGGGVPVYYKYTDSGIAIGSRPSMVIENPTPDLGYASALFALHGAEGNLLSNRSSVNGVEYLNAGQTLSINGHNRVQVQSHIPPREYGTMQETVDRLRDALIHAIERRVELYEGLSADVSGGLDSTAIGAIIGSLGLRTGFKTFSAISPNHITDDRYYLDEFRRVFPDIDHHNLDSTTALRGFTNADVLAFKSHEDLAVAHIVDPSAQSYVNDYYTFIYGLGGGPVHLTGNGGDELFHFSPHTTRIAVHRPLEMLRGGFYSARLLNARPLDVWEAAVRVARSTPEAILGRQLSLLRRGDGDYYQHALQRSKLLPWSVRQGSASLMTPESRRMAADYLEGTFSKNPYVADMSMEDIIESDRLLLSGRSFEAIKFLVASTGLGIDVQAPFLDAEVIKAACLAAPYERANPDNFKKILKLALHDILPPELRTRATKGSYSRNRSETMQGSTGAILDLLKTSRLVEAGLLDESKLLQYVCAEGVITSDMYRALTQFVSAELWIRELEKMRPHDSSQSASKVTIAATEQVRITTLPIEGITDHDEEIALPGYVYDVRFKSGGVSLFNTRSMKFWTIADPAWSQLLEVLVSCGSVSKSVQFILEAAPYIDASILTNKMDEIKATAFKYGMLDRAAENEEHRPLHVEANAPDFISGAAKIAYEAENKSRFRDSVLTAGALAASLALNRFAPSQKLPLMQLLHDKWANKEATEIEAERLLNAAHSLGFLGRIACAEGAYAATLAALVTRKRARFHVGVSDFPLSYHAWMSVRGTPINPAKGGLVEGSYQSYF